MNRRTLGALVGLPLLAAPAFVSAAQSQDRVQDDRARALETLRKQSDQAGDPLKIHDGAYGMPRYLSGRLSEPMKGNVGLEEHALNFLRGQSKLFPMDLSQLELVKVTTDAKGGHHLRFEQSYLGIPVFQAKVNVHMDRDGVVRGVNTSAVSRINLNANPTLSRDDVFARVNELTDDGAFDVQGATLYVYPTRTTNYLAYQVPLMTDAGMRVFWIDAHNGKLIWSENPMRDAGTTGSGIDAQGNSVSSLNIYQGRTFFADVSPMFRPYIQSATRGRFNLVDETTPDLGKIYTLTSNETYLMDIDWVYSNDKSFDDTSNNNHPAGVSAHVFYRQTLDFYKKEFNRMGIDNEGLSISAVVQVMGLPDYPLECNAGWLGYGYNFMIFGMGGDCFGYDTYPFSASLDVIGHELNHGVDEFTINLGYNHESGALNEHFADVFGVLTEAANSTPDWLIGEDLFVNPDDPETAFRNFADPAEDSVLMAQPDSMSVYFTAPVSYDAGGVHFNSGIPNKVFYLTVAGGTFNGVTVPAIASNQNDGRHMAGQLWYDVMNNERVSNISQFVDLRDALIDAAETLYPDKVGTLQAAWQAVGVVNDLYPTASQDTQEPNDYPGLAMNLNVGSSASQYIWSRNDADIYQVQLDAGRTYQIKLSGLTFDAALGVYSVGPYSTLTSQAASNNDGTFDETITFQPNTSDTYYVEVIPDQNTGSRSSKYTLSVAKQ